jgi:hypothetical protein
LRSAHRLLIPVVNMDRRHTPEIAIPRRQRRKKLPTISEIQVCSFFIRRLFVCFRSGAWTPP